MGEDDTPRYIVSCSDTTSDYILVIESWSIVSPQTLREKGLISGEVTGFRSEEYSIGRIKELIKIDGELEKRLKSQSDFVLDKKPRS